MMKTKNLKMSAIILMLAGTLALGCNESNPQYPNGGGDNGGSNNGGDNGGGGNGGGGNGGGGNGGGGNGGGGNGGGEDNNTPNDGKPVALKGTVLAPNDILADAYVVVEDGKITCVGKDCDVSAAHVVSCGQDCVISPGLINAHDHITFNHNVPYTGKDRYDHRHDWRKGLNGKKRVITFFDGNPAYAEVRMLFGATTSVAGSGAFPGLVRNLDTGNALGGLNNPNLVYETFPLGKKDSDRDAVQRKQYHSSHKIPECSAFNVDKRKPGIFHAHVSEGIDAYTENEFKCFFEARKSFQIPTVVVHGVGVTTQQIKQMSENMMSLVWSPRTNVFLYGITADVPTYKNLGVKIALGTDWTRSGSMNLLREFKCVDYLNTHNLAKTFSDKEIWEMATSTGADVLGFGDQIGKLAKGYVADIAVFRVKHKDGTMHEGYRAVLDAEVEDVILTMIGGKALYGEKNYLKGILTAEQAEKCEDISQDDCLSTKSICLSAGGFKKGYASIKRGEGGDPKNDIEKYPPYPFYFCGTPEKEPSCVPWREDDPKIGLMSMQEDKDGDGIKDADDNCSDIFNHRQTDQDKDGKGDSCDPCPFDNNPECKAVEPIKDDKDKDGIKDDVDNCPKVENPDQKDADGDGVGDVCDPCEHDNKDNCFDVYMLNQRMREKKDEIKGKNVQIKNMYVTHVAGKNAWVQYGKIKADNKSAADSAVLLFDGDTVKAGECYDIKGTVDDYHGEHELVNYTVTPAEGCEMPEPAVLTTTIIEKAGELAKYGGAYVAVKNVTVASSKEIQIGKKGKATVYTFDNNLNAITQFIQKEKLEIGTTYASFGGILRFYSKAYTIFPFDMSQLVTDSGLSVRIDPADGDLMKNKAHNVSLMLNTPSAAAVALTTACTGDCTCDTSATIEAMMPSADFTVTTNDVEEGSCTLKVSYTDEGKEKSTTATYNVVGTVFPIKNLALSKANPKDTETFTLTVNFNEALAENLQLNVKSSNEAIVASKLNQEVVANETKAQIELSVISATVEDVVLTVTVEGMDETKFKKTITVHANKADENPTDIKEPVIVTKEIDESKIVYKWEFTKGVPSTVASTFKSVIPAEATQQATMGFGSKIVFASNTVQKDGLRLNGFDIKTPTEEKSINLSDIGLVSGQPNVCLYLKLYRTGSGPKKIVVSASGNYKLDEKKIKQFITYEYCFDTAPADIKIQPYDATQSNGGLRVQSVIIAKK